MGYVGILEPSGSPELPDGAGLVGLTGLSEEIWFADDRLRESSADCNAEDLKRESSLL